MRLIDQLEEQFKLGYVNKRQAGNLVLYNYTDNCTYERAWNETTIKARGIVLDTTTGEVVAHPFHKFFNLGEHESTFLTNLPDLPYEVYDKVDGSLGIIYSYQDIWRINTRGSFDSEQAQRATKIFDAKYREKFNENVPCDTTILVEIIYPENRFNDGARLVCDYGSTEDLILLGVNNGQLELVGNELTAFGELIGMPVVGSFDYTIEEMIELQKTLPKTREGFVVRYSNGLRVKIKGAEYCKMQKILNSVSPLSTWEVMKNGKVQEEYLSSLPEEILPEINEYKNKLEMMYSNVMEEIKTEFLSNLEFAVPELGKSSPEMKKQVGLFVSKNPESFKHRPAVFLFLLDRYEELDRYCMKQIRPHGNNL